MSRTLFGKLLRRGPRPRPRTVRPALPDDIQAIRQRALLGHHLEQVLWGKVLLNSQFMPPDPKAALVWFRMAADAGYGPAHNMLGRCSHFGWGCPRSLEDAGQHYARAAQLGDNWGRYNLAILTMRGLGRPQDLPTAFALFRTGAEAGHAKSMNIMARFYEEGWVVNQDRAMARQWYHRSAQEGDYRGQHNYATLLAEAGDVQQALHWWEQALPDATPDVLLAVERILPQLGKAVPADFATKVATRLEQALRERETARQNDDSCEP
ncbi:SEL1-like repeat protein [Acetobacter sp. TBRC 12305]|uniref:Sel1 repeat family protein n=1 Tax=Acetobacter garciniae TaxID=2817435 RepID=A0A939HH46_9PROT|nr:tetratricopeptide repeat protein [Acetobacter garciniae]MBO1324290.1 sel1 repeat family protein [Acetobacter garciniae]MBX0343979.1 SEL1-like repeat protein [Acetobacter garciniae]